MLPNPDKNAQSDSSLSTSAPALIVRLAGATDPKWSPFDGSWRRPVEFSIVSNYEDSNSDTPSSNRTKNSKR